MGWPSVGEGCPEVTTPTSAPSERITEPDRARERRNQVLARMHARGHITAEERTLLQELRELTLDTITVDDFDTEELRSAGYRAPEGARGQSREAA